MELKKFRSFLDVKSFDYALFYNSSSVVNSNLFYFSGYSGIGALIVPVKHEPFLIVPDMELERAKKSQIKEVYSMDKKKFFESIYQIIKRRKIKTKNIAMDYTNFNLNSYKVFKKNFKKVKTKDISLDCLKMRQIKSDKEIEITKESCYYSDKIMQKAISNFKDFKTESDASAFLSYEARVKGLELAFEPIIASGSNSSMPHYKPSSKIKNGFCVVDFGVKYKGYCSDMTRTIYIGKPSQKEKDIYKSLLKIQIDAINQIKINKKCSELYNYVNDQLGEYKRYFTHGLGHGIGVEIHELPNLTLNSKDRIKNNMAFTIEPGVYFPNKFGIRIEDSLLFKNKPILLTNTTKDLLIS